MTDLYHYTCAHQAAGIDRTGEVLPLVLLLPRRRALPWVATVAWFTDLARPDRHGLGLTSHTLRCDRTERRYRVTDASNVVPYARWARHAAREDREELEGVPGARPAHWYVADCGVPVVAA